MHSRQLKEWWVGRLTASFACSNDRLFAELVRAGSGSFQCFGATSRRQYASSDLAMADCERVLEASARTLDADIYTLWPGASNAQSVLGLSSTDVLVLGTVALITQSRWMRNFLCVIPRVATDELIDLLPSCCALERADVSGALGVGGRLFASGLLEAHQGEKVFALEPSGLAVPILVGSTPASSLLDALAPAIDTDALPVSAFEFLGVTLDVLRAVVSCKSPCSILIHGTPGVGKTALARALFADSGREVRELGNVGTMGEPLLQRDRAARTSAAINIIGPESGIGLIIDEAEDLLVCAAADASSSHKPWLNQLLDRRVAPTIWVANSLFGVNPAHLRRFDLCIPMGCLPPSRRSALARTHLRPRGAPRSAVEAVAASPRMTPAWITLCGEILSRSGESLAAKACDMMLDLRRIPPINTRWPVDPKLFSASCPLDGAIDALGLVPSRLLISGPNGTGKSELASWLLRCVDVDHIAVSLPLLLAGHFGSPLVFMEELFSISRRGVVLDHVDSVEPSPTSRALLQALVEELGAFRGPVVAIATNAERTPVFLRAALGVRIETEACGPSVIRRALAKIARARTLSRRISRYERRRWSESLEGARLSHIAAAIATLPADAHEGEVISEIRSLGASDPNDRSVGFKLQRA